MEIVYTSVFRRAFRKLSRDVQERAAMCEKIFRSDPFASSLKTHKLTGRLEGCWAFSVSYNYRIIFMLGKNNTAEFIAIGTHDIYE